VKNTAATFKFSKIKLEKIENILVQYNGLQTNYTFEIHLDCIPYIVSLSSSSSSSSLSSGKGEICHKKEIVVKCNNVVKVLLYLKGVHLREGTFGVGS